MLRMIFILSFFFATAALAQSRSDDAVRLSKLSLSAMECANFASSSAEAKRLQDVALGAGKKFLDLMPKLSEDELKTALPNIAVLWRGASGPSVDFVLGRAWEIMSNIAYKSLGEDTKRWDAEKTRRFAEKNCSLIQ